VIVFAAAATDSDLLIQDSCYVLPCTVLKRVSTGYCYDVVLAEICQRGRL
jgi:hypothetical protein